MSPEATALAQAAAAPGTPPTKAKGSAPRPVASAVIRAYRKTRAGSDTLGHPYQQHHHAHRQQGHQGDAGVPRLPVAVRQQLRHDQVQQGFYISTVEFSRSLRNFSD